MKVCGVQFDIAWENPRANFARVRNLLRDSPPGRGALVILPELFACGFSMNVDSIAEDEPRPTEKFLVELGAEFGVFALGGVAARSDGRVQNQAVVTNPDGRIVARYSKLHLFSPSGENRAYAPGDDVVLFNWHGFKVAPLVCYDLRFPEIFRRAVRRGANLFAVIANWPSARVNHWITLLQARAIENQAYVIGVNRCGSDPHLAYPGQSMIVDPRGNIFADVGADECIMRAQIHIATVDDFRCEIPVLPDIREEFSS